MSAVHTALTPAMGGAPVRLLNFSYISNILRRGGRSMWWEPLGSTRIEPLRLEDVIAKNVLVVQADERPVRDKR